MFLIFRAYHRSPTIILATVLSMAQRPFPVGPKL